MKIKKYKRVLWPSKKYNLINKQITENVPFDIKPYFIRPTGQVDYILVAHLLVEFFILKSHFPPIFCGWTDR